VNNPSKPTVVVVIGATATGKTALGVELALEFDGEIVNGDSRLFYKGMDIATAKPTGDEMRGVPHHLIDILNPNEQFDVASYLKQARAVIDEIVGRGKLPIIIGGSGQYIWALIEGWEVPEIEPDVELRGELERKLADSGVESLAAELRSISPEVAEDTDLLNPRRVIRAIERARSSSSESVPSRKKADVEPFNALIVGLSVERPVLHQRVLDRLAVMINDGWKDEVQTLLEAGYSADDRALSGIGYRQMIGHLAGEFDHEEAVRLTAVATNRLIRRQNNWFKQDDPRINWFDMTSNAEEQAKSIISTAKSWRNIDP
jgi:tRNA dimethylallyltransferase